MKTATSFLLFLTAFASLLCAQSKAIPTAVSAPSVDKVKLEAYLRHLELWPPSSTSRSATPTPLRSARFQPGHRASFL